MRHSFSLQLPSSLLIFQVKDGKKESVSFDFTVHNFLLSSLIAFSFTVSQLDVQEEACGRWAAVVNLENVFLFPLCTEHLRRCAVIYCEGEQGCPGILLSIDLQSCCALLGWLVCTVLSLSVEGFPLALAHLLTLSESIAVHSQETGCGKGL